MLERAIIPFLFGCFWMWLAPTQRRRRIAWNVAGVAIVVGYVFVARATGFMR